MNSAPSVVVEGVEIPARLIAAEAQNHPSLNPSDAWRDAGRALAVKALLLHRARELGLAPAPRLDAEGREETGEEALIRATLDAELKIEPASDAACRRVYDAERASFRTPPLYEASHILIEGAGEAGMEAARLGAERVIRRLARDPGRFAALAREMSTCSSAREGGSLGQFRAGDLAREVEDALCALEPGEIAPTPVASRFGWHVVKLDRRVEGRQLPFDYVAERIRARLDSRAWLAAATRYTQTLAARARGFGVALTLAEETRVVDGSRTLGDLLAEDAVTRFGPWLEAVDPALAAAIGRAAREEGSEILDFVRRAVSHFAATAGDEGWTQLISAAQGGEDPAAAAIAVILRSKLSPRRTPVTLLKTT